MATDINPLNLKLGAKSIHVLPIHELEKSVSRKVFLAAIGFCCALAISISPTVQAETNAPDKGANMIITKNGSQASIPGPDEWFTGRARIDPIHLEPQGESQLTSALVTFEPNARSNWHTHPRGQLLIVTSGKGWVQQEGQARKEINAGDSVWCPANQKHWHGATSTTAMSHIAIQEAKDGKNVEWLEAVTNKQYLD